MQQQGENPTVAGRRLRTELRKLRDAGVQAQTDVACALEWSVSKLIRIESGAVSISKSDLIALLHHYGVNNQARVDELIDLARASRRVAWWDAYRDRFSPSMVEVLSYHDQRVRLRRFHATIVPGSLQAREYASAVMTSCGSTRPFDGFVHARLDRQLLAGDSARREAFFVLDEAVLRQRIASSPTCSSGGYSTSPSLLKGVGLTPGLAGVAVHRNAAATAMPGRLSTALAVAEQSLVNAGIDSQPLQGAPANSAELKRHVAANDQTTNREAADRAAPNHGDVSRSAVAPPLDAPWPARTRETDDAARNQRPTSGPTGSYRVFISYGHEDRDRATAVKREQLLTEFGLPVFQDDAIQTAGSSDGWMWSMRDGLTHWLPKPKHMPWEPLQESPALTADHWFTDNVYGSRPMLAVTPRLQQLPTVRNLLDQAHQVQVVCATPTTLVLGSTTPDHLHSRSLDLPPDTDRIARKPLQGETQGRHQTRQPTLRNQPKRGSS